jgi:hypothetical protein
VAVVGEAVFVTNKSAADPPAALTVTSVEAVSFAALVSSGLLTETLLVTTPVVLLSGLARTCSVAVAPAASVPRSPVIVPPATLTLPVSVDAETSVRPAGKASVNVDVVADASPTFWTLIV